MIDIYNQYIYEDCIITNQDILGMKNFIIYTNAQYISDEQIKEMILFYYQIVKYFEKNYGYIDLDQKQIDIIANEYNINRKILSYFMKSRVYIMHMLPKGNDKIHVNIHFNDEESESIFNMDISNKNIIEQCIVSYNGLMPSEGKYYLKGINYKKYIDMIFKIKC